MVSLLERGRMQMYRRKKARHMHHAAEKTETFSAGRTRTNQERQSSEESNEKGKGTIVVESKGNIFENMIEKVIPTVDRAAEAEKNTAKESDDTLLAQIDEFRVRAQQLQQLLDTKQEKADELQQIVSEREDKAEKLEKIVKERQSRADGITEAIEQKIESMASNMDTKLDEVATSVNAELKAGQDKEDERDARLQETLNRFSEKIDGMSSVSEQLDTVKADISEKIHIENVQSYRNVSELLKKVEGKLRKLDVLEAEVARLRSVTLVIIILTIINLVGMIVSILANLGFITL